MGLFPLGSRLDLLIFKYDPILFHPLGWHYIIADFFAITGISYIQTMSVVWRILYWIYTLNNNESMSLDVADIATMYDLQTFGSSSFVLKVKAGHPHLVLKTRHNDRTWKERFFFVKRSSIPNGVKFAL